MKKVQMTGIAVSTNGNGNGNGHKKIETPASVREEATAVIAEPKIKIVPTFNQLTTKGKEMFAAMDKLENAKLFLDDLVMEIGNEHTTIAGLLLLLQAIREKAENPWKHDHPVDFISYLQTHLFNWTCEADKCSNEYIQAVKSGNFIVEKFIETETPTDLSRPEEMMPMKDKAAKTEKTDVLDETILDEPELKTVKTDAIKGGQLASVLSDLLNNSNLPGKLHNALFDGIAEIADPRTLEGADFDPKFINDAFAYQDKKRNEIKSVESLDVSAAAAEETGSSLTELLSALCNHDDCPQWISDAILDGFNDRLCQVNFTPEYFTYALAEAVPDTYCPICNNPKLDSEMFIHDGCRKFLAEMEDAETAVNAGREKLAA